jgi:hypothetical protein
MNFQIINASDPTCVASVDATLPVSLGINILAWNNTLLSDGSVVLSIDGQSFHIEKPCFGMSSRIVSVVGILDEPESNRSTEREQGHAGKPMVVGGFVLGPQGETRAPIHYGDFDGTTVMYLDVTEDA